MDEIELRRIDLNLLVVLEVLLREHSVTKTARQLHLTPSAVSHALKRLREVFDDELLIRDGRRMRPTVRAEGMAETLPRVLEQLRRALAGPAPFDPEASHRTFRLVAPDFIAPLLPHLLKEVGAAAPRVRVELSPFSGASVSDLADRRSDVVIAPSRFEHEGVRSTPIGHWPWVVYGRADHPAFSDWSVGSWARFPHLQVRVNARAHAGGPVDVQAAANGVERVIGAVVPHFSMAPPILAETHMLLTVPKVVLAQVAALHGLACREVPLDLPPMGLSVHRNAAAANEPGVRWFVEQVMAATKTLTE